ncbi:MAG: phosphoglycolate phosphatase [Thermoprotei archaeon]
MKRFRALALDVDGTLTINREEYTIHLGAIYALRKLVEKNYTIVLISSSALPIVAGLQRYLGLKGPTIGESGALILTEEGEIIRLARNSAREAYTSVLNKYNEYVMDSWQNLFRLYDYALKVKPEYRSRDREIVSMITEYVEREYPNIRVGYSGYAIHLTPSEVSKGKALEYIAEYLGIDLEEFIGVGDSVMDLEFLEKVGLSVTFQNADPELIAKADLVLSKPSGYGVEELAKKLLSGTI